MNKYPMYQNQEDETKLKPGLYLGLFHGFKNMKERVEAQCWGVHGPVIGPLEWIHCAYMTTMNGQFEMNEDAQQYGFKNKYDIELNFNDQGDCIIFDGMEYGDWSIFYHSGK